MFLIELMPAFVSAREHDPIGGVVPKLLTVISGPGSGNSRSMDSRVLQPLPTLATKASGRELNEMSTGPDPDPALMVTLAQFIYISRLPTVLNHVQENTAGPVGVSLGTVKGKSETRGQLPM
jgi:hypothetical protein